jgi:teichuronic acid biosynthesis glycosyltransferase TuaG
LNSVFIQKVENIEIILVNDFSDIPPDTSIINEFIRKGLVINVINHKTNLGPGIARFTGLKASKSKYIAFLDSDDEWLLNKIKIQLTQLLDTNSDCTASKVIDREIIKNTECERGKFFNEPSFLQNLLNEKISIPMSTIIIDRKILFEKLCLIKNNEDFNLDHFELLLIMSSMRFHFINEILAIYHLHDNNISKNNTYYFHYAKVLYSFFLKNFNKKRTLFLNHSIQYFFKGLLHEFTN